MGVILIKEYRLSIGLEPSEWTESGIGFWSEKDSVRPAW